MRPYFCRSGKLCFCLKADGPLERSRWRLCALHVVMKADVVASARTGPELFERLENQLCGDYLRDNRSTRGIFVLGRNGKKAGWDVPGGANRVDFEGLIAALQNRWEEIAHAFPGVDEVTVIGVDLLKRAA